MVPPVIPVFGFDLLSLGTYHISIRAGELGRVLVQSIMQLTALMALPARGRRPAQFVCLLIHWIAFGVVDPNRATCTIPIGRLALWAKRVEVGRLVESSDGRNARTHTHQR